MSRPTVVLLHGLLRTQRSLRRLRQALDADGHPTWSCTYPSRELAVRDCAEYVRERLAEVPGPYVAVTHSMGAIVVRHLPELPWRGAVMLAPPSQGSRIAARLRHGRAFHWLYGPAGQDMGGPASWALPACQAVVLVGTRKLSWSNPTSWLTVGLGMFPEGEPHDGTVAQVESALPGVEPEPFDASHTWIMNHPAVIRRVRAAVDGFSSG